MTSPTPTLFEALGAEGGIRDAVDIFYKRVLADPDLAGYFADVDMTTLRKHQVDMLVTATGGPRHYTGREMSAAHHGLNITDAAFAKVVGHLGATLADAGVGEDSINQVVAALAPLQTSIVSA